MNLEFRRIQAEDLERLGAFFCKRPNKTCDSVIFDSFLWQDFYHVKYAVSGGEAIQWLMEEEGAAYSAMPVCSQERLPHYFREIQDYFNQVLKQPLQIPAADEDAVEYLGLAESPDYVVEEQEDARDYLYEADALRNLSGKKLRKKKNHLNFFMREYAGRYEYRPLNCGDKEEIWKFLDRWREQKGEDVEVHLEYEVAGIHDVLRNCAKMPVSMAGVCLDGKLEAFTIGSYNPLEKMAIIHIEKANPKIRGLYQYINRQFLIEAFPQASLVNREDDMGQEGLRKAKLSYDPCGYARKYFVRQVW